MTERTEGAATTAVAANRGVKRGLPSKGLADAEAAAKALWEIARRSRISQDAYAEKLGRKGATGGGWDTLMSMLRGFGLIIVQDDQIGLSDSGLKIVNDSDLPGQIAARRSAMMKLKAYRDLVESYDGTVLPDISAIASRLKYEYGKNDDFAEKAANSFVGSLRHANMIDDAGKVHAAGSPAAKDSELDPAPDLEEEDERLANAIDDAFEAAEREEVVESVALDSRQSQGDAGGVVVNISVSLDLSKYRSDEVVTILRALGV